jgi:hypothetical protein
MQYLVWQDVPVVKDFAELKAAMWETGEPNRMTLKFRKLGQE